MTRRKDTAAPAPATAAEATLMIGEFVAIDRSIALERLAAEDAMDKIKADCDRRIRALERLAAEIAGAKIGIRLTPPAVKFRRGVKIGDVVTWLGSLRWARAKDFLRTKIDLDKQAVIKAVSAEEKMAETFAAYLTVEQADEFFIDTGLDQDELAKEIAAS